MLRLSIKQTLRRTGMKRFNLLVRLVSSDERIAVFFKNVEVTKVLEAFAYSASTVGPLQTLATFIGRGETFGYKLYPKETDLSTGDKTLEISWNKGWNYSFGDYKHGRVVNEKSFSTYYDARIHAMNLSNERDMSIFVKDKVITFDYKKDRAIDYETRVVKVEEVDSTGVTCWDFNRRATRKFLFERMRGDVTEVK
jgi:hypothetical protein